MRSKQESKPFKNYSDPQDTNNNNNKTEKMEWMATKHRNKIIREEKYTAKRRDGTIHQGRFFFIVSRLLSSGVFLFVLFIYPFERFGFLCRTKGGGRGRGGLPGGWLIIVCVCCFCNYIPEIPIEERGWVIIGLTILVNFDYSFVIISELLPW